MPVVEFAFDGVVDRLVAAFGIFVVSVDVIMVVSWYKCMQEMQLFRN